MTWRYWPKIKPMEIDNLSNYKPKGPEIELTSTGILSFLETQMNDPARFHAVPHLLSPSNLAFQLSGREMALEVAADCMKKISKPITQTTRFDRKIPVCAGLSGLSKSRMLEEWERIFDLAKIEGPRIGVLVLYYNGHSPSPVERSMTIEASFSWRLLHRLFIEGSGMKFGKWFKEKLPKNGRQLDLRTALGMSWARARDRSLCLLTDDFEVMIPYAIFHRVAILTPKLYSPVEECFIKCVQGMIEKIDAFIYDKELWELWEDFGAYFHALRINAMIIIGKSVIEVSKLFCGALVKGCKDQVKLVPTKVRKLEGSMKSSIGRKRHSKAYNWLTKGYVGINGANGKDVDIFFALKNTQNNGYVVCLDQRKRVAGTNLGLGGIPNLLSDVAIKPTTLGDLYDPITVVPLLFNSLRSTNVQEITGQDAVVVTYSQMMSYHQGLWLHPASSPCVNVNKDPLEIARRFKVSPQK